MNEESGAAAGLADAFIERWKSSGAAERANYQLFLSELCDVLGVGRPDPASPDDGDNAYVFERSVTFRHGDASTSVGRIDLYKRGCFVLEAKQGVDRRDRADESLRSGTAPAGRRGSGVRGTRGWDDTMLRARGQAEAYAKALPVAEGWPPFLVIADVGHSIELWADFSRTGKHYTQFPDASTFRIGLDELSSAALRERLRLVWTEPLALDPARLAARVTREIADRLARLAKSLEAAGHAPKSVASFLMRCLFTMFAEDVELLTKGSFRRLLESLRGEADKFPPLARELWETMNRGGFSTVLREKLLRFNGGLFQESDALPLSEEQLALLIEAAAADWRDVEPAIFGTLLERALEPTERHKLGAHYTPRAYVERLVMPTVIEPLREDWDNVKAAAVALTAKGDAEKARREITAFHQQLCATRVLDPACGSGNFLYVTLEHMKRLEGEVIDLLRELGEDQYLLEMERHSVDPHQFLGIEVNPRAAAIAELVLWIGYLQWHFRTRGRAMPAEPVLKNFRNIECRDAVLAWDKIELARDEAGKPITRWDGRTYRKSPVTGEDVPDETAQVEEYHYINPRAAEWPAAEFIVGNPPFIANRNMRRDLGDGYTDALKSAFVEVAEPVDFVMLFWLQGTIRSRRKARRVGLISTNSIRMQQNQSVMVTLIKDGWHLIFAIPDHPWPSESDRARVRISMVTAAHEDIAVKRLVLAADHDSVARIRNQSVEIIETDLTTLLPKIISPDLSASTDISELAELESNGGLCHAGVKPYARTLLVTDKIAHILFKDSASLEKHAPRFRNGRDIGQYPRDVRVLDFYGLTEEDIRSAFPDAYQYLLNSTKPERSQERNPRLRREWWLFEANRPEMRNGIRGLARYLVTLENSPARYFTFVDGSILPDQKLRVVCADSAYLLAILSSKGHELFSKRLGGRTGVANTPVYNTRCFTLFPFPACTDEQKARIRDLGEQLDGHRKARQKLHPDLTLTAMYNVLEKLRAGAALTAKDRDIHEKGLVSVLRQIHDDLDRAVFDAYGWPADLTDEQILERLVALNRERAAEEKRGLVRWLRPEFQAPETARAARPEQAEMDVAEPAVAAKAAGKRAWPKALPDQVQSVRSALAAQGVPATGTEIARIFKGARAERVDEVLAALAALGQARRTPDGRYAA